METFRKSERLCNFTYKELLFKKGQSFFNYPFRVYYLVVEPELEKLFYKDDVGCYEGAQMQSPMQQQQNPSWPQRSLPANAYFHFPAKCLVAVSRKSFPRAVDRNRIKRIVKEAYRKNKSPFYTFLQNKDVFCLLALVYSAKNLISFQEAESKMIVTLQKLQHAIDQQTLGGLAAQ